MHFQNLNQEDIQRRRYRGEYVRAIVVDGLKYEELILANLFSACCIFNNIFRQSNFFGTLITETSQYVQVQKNHPSNLLELTFPPFI